MKAVKCVKTEVDVKYVLITVPVNFEDEQMPYDFPLRNGSVWTATIVVDTGKILDWPEGVDGQLYLKVVDEGCYTLMDENMNIVASLNGDYVPHGLIPGDYGDYVDFEIDENGVITNWPKHPDLDDFPEFVSGDE